MKPGSFEYIEKKLREISKSETEKGRNFAELYKFFFENYPFYKNLFKKIYHWEDWPKRWGRDKGIDLIAITKNNKCWAIQAKGYEKKYNPTKHDLDKFLSESNRKIIQNRIFISTSSSLGANAKEVVEGQEKPTSIILRDTLLSVNFNWPLSLKQKKIKKINYNLYPYQAKIVNESISKLKKINDGKLIMACGTGKTFVSLRIDEMMNNKSTLFIVPTLSLIQQQIKEWSEKAKKPFDALIICSKNDVMGSKDERTIDPNQILLPPTENPKDVINFLKKRTFNRKVIFSTYHSLDKVQIALKKIRYNFDFTIFDEAHHTAGSKNNFSLGLNRKNIKTKKRMFMTATPLIINERRVNYYKKNGFEIISMDHKEYGQILSKYDFSDAMRDKTLARYEVLCVGTSDREIKELANKGTKIYSKKTGETDYRYLGGQVGLLDSINKYKMKRIITFHSRIKSASNFVNSDKKESIQNAMNFYSSNKKPNLICDHVSSEVNMSDRLRILKNLKEVNKISKSSTGIVSNCFCLGEGVDVPALNCVALIDPKNSPIEITQIVGRAIRKPRKEKKDVGYVFLPIHLQDQDKDKDVDEIAGFKNTIRVLRALRSHDKDLSNAIDELTHLKIDQPSEAKRIFDQKFKLILPKGFSEKNFINNIKSRLIEITADNWEAKYIQLKKYFDKHGNTDVPVDWPPNPSLYNWCETQRSVYRQNKISDYRINKLKDLNFRLETDPKPSWEEMYQLLIEYKKINNSTNIPTKPINDKIEEKNRKFYQDNHRLDIWSKTQRQNKEKGILSLSREKKLNKINFSWILNRFVNDFKQIQALENYVLKNKKFPATLTENRQLYAWISNLRARKKKKRIIPEEVLERLNKINFSWDGNEEKWNSNLEFLTNEWIKNNKSWSNLSNKVTRTCIQIRSSMKKGLKGINQQTRKKIKREFIDYKKRIKQLDKINFPHDPKEVFENEIIELMIKYKRKFGTLNIGKTNDEYEFSKKLVNYINNIKRTNFDYVSDRMKLKLKKIGFKYK